MLTVTEGDRLPEGGDGGFDSMSQPKAAPHAMDALRRLATITEELNGLDPGTWATNAIPTTLGTFVINRTLPTKTTHSGIDETYVIKQIRDAQGGRGWGVLYGITTAAVAFPGGDPAQTGHPELRLENVLNALEVAKGIK